MFCKAAVVLCFVLYSVAASDQKDDGSRDSKLGIFSPTGIGGVIGTLGILKLKALFVSLIVLAIATVFSKIFSGCGSGGLLCGTEAIPASAHSSYNDYGYGWNSQRNAKSLSDTYNEFLAGVSESLDMVEGGFKTLGIETEPCKKKFICLADNEALENPILGLAFRIFGSYSEDSCNAADLEELQIDPEKIRGDAIGDTLYSERYVIKLLMKLTEIQDDQWNEDMESDMCTLWDMTAQPAVVTFLMQHDSLRLFINVIQSTTVPRLMEIMVGLLGNMCCVKEVRDEIAKQEEMQDTLLELLTCPDSPTLIQLVRLFQSITWDLIKPDAQSFASADQHWFEKQMANSQFPLNLSFILSSSTCDELLMAVIELLYLCSLNISDKDFSQYVATPELVDGMVECWSQLFSACKEEGRFEFLNKSLEKAGRHWIMALLAFAGHEKGRTSLGRCAKDINSILTDLIEEPKSVSEEAVLISAISLLEAIVGYHFCPVVFCKTLVVLPKVIENGAEGYSDECDGLDDSQVSELTLKESLGNYFVEVVKKVDNLTLEATLQTCEEKLVKIFWSVITEWLPVNTA